MFGTGRHKTPGSTALCMCIGKFNTVNGELTAEHRGTIFQCKKAQQQGSCVARSNSHRSMSETKARRILAASENTCVWCSRVDFIEALAAIACVFREEVLCRGEKKGKFTST